MTDSFTPVPTPTLPEPPAASYVHKVSFGGNTLMVKHPLYGKADLTFFVHSYSPPRRLVLTSAAPD